MTTTLENACNLYLGELKIDLSIDIYLILGGGGHDLANDAPINAMAGTTVSSTKEMSQFCQREEI